MIVIFTPHARYQLKERGLNEKEVIRALTNTKKTIIKKYLHL